MKVVNIHEWTPKQFLSPTLNPKNILIGLKKVKTTPKLSQNQMGEMKETMKMKIIALYEKTSKQFEPDPTLKIAIV